MLRHLFVKKPITNHDEHTELHRTLSAFDLTLMGIGAIIGAGVFVLTGVAAATEAGPAIVISYIIAGLAALFAALSYAELASSIGGTGSAYSYAYSGFGEFIAWIIGWDLLLEYSMAVATVAIGWSGYVVNFFEAFDINLPKAITANPFNGGIIDLPAVLIIFLLAGLLCLGVRQSAKFNAAVVVIKLLTIALFIAVAAVNVNPDNWHPFMPFGIDGIIDGAAIVFFAYIGFDALSTAVEEAKEPQRSVPIGIISSLFICTLIYVIVSALLTGVAHYTTLNVQSPVADALIEIDHDKAAGFIAVGAIAGLTTVMLVMYYGLTRICLAMARDGLIPKRFAAVNKQTHTPVRVIMSTAVIIAAVAGFTPIGHAAEMVNIGTLTAFAAVCLGVAVLRRTHKDLHRPFKLPYSPLIPALGVIFCMYLAFNLSYVTWIRFFGWFAIGIAIYFAYGYRHSVNRPEHD